MAQPVLGVNFSPRQAEWLGLNADETYSALLNDLRVRFFRLSLYWDEIQPEPTRYDFSRIQRMLEARRQPYVLAVRSNHHLRFLTEAGLLQTNPAELADEVPAEAWSITLSAASAAPLSPFMMPVSALIAMAESDCNAPANNSLSNRPWNTAPCATSKAAPKFW